MKILSQSDLNRFWGKVDKEKSTTFYNGTRCWEWTAYRDLAGYGQFGIGVTVEIAHRVSWVISNNNILDGLHVLHHCDNPACVRVDHLFLGTNLENVRDRELKKRGKQPRGEKNGSSKLSWNQVREIRHRYKWGGIGGDDSVTLSKEFGVSKQTVLEIVKNENWKE